MGTFQIPAVNELLLTLIFFYLSEGAEALSMKLFDEHLISTTKSRIGHGVLRMMKLQ